MENIGKYEIKAVKNDTDFKVEKLTSSLDSYNVIKQFYHDDMVIYESFFILMLSRSNETIGYAKISQGGVSGTVVDTKIVAKYCIDSLCSAVILAHNHPSGNLVPSHGDKKVTKNIKNALQHFDIPVLDHLILSDESYYSFADEGELNNL